MRKEKEKLGIIPRFLPEQLHEMMCYLLKKTSSVGGSILDFEDVKFEIPIRHSDGDIKWEIG